MRIYNGKKSTLTIPLSGNQKLSIPPHSTSGDFMPNKDFLSLIMTTFDYNEISLIVSGPFEISMCSQVSGCAGFVSYSEEEAIEKFSKEKPKEKPIINPAILKEESRKENKPVEETLESTEKKDEEVTPVPVEEPKTEEEPKAEEAPAKKIRRTVRKKAAPKSEEEGGEE